MNRFVAGAVSCLLLVSLGLFWWQGRAEQNTLAQTERSASQPPSVPAALPEGDDSLVGKAPPKPPEAPQADREAKRFNRYDKNRDEVITRLEMMSTRTNSFKKLDKDGNNLLSFEEWAVGTSDRFEGADGNRDGKLTRTEFATTAPKRTPKPKCNC